MLHKKVVNYVYNSWYGVHCHNREDIERICSEVIKENPDETNFTKLGLIAKRRCMGELVK